MNNTVIIIVAALTLVIVAKRLGLTERLMGIRSINAREAGQLVDGGQVLVLDVRTGQEYAAAHIPGSRHVPLADFGRRLGELEPYRERPILVSCRSGSRSARACALLKRRGYAEVYNLKGGLKAWAGADLDLER